MLITSQNAQIDNTNESNVMKTINEFVVALLLFFCVPVQAQYGTIPNDFQKNIGMFIGNWEGTMEYYMPNGAVMKVHGSATGEWILDETAILMIPEVEISTGVFLKFASLISWDLNQKTGVVQVASNQGYSYRCTGTWIMGDTISFHTQGEYMAQDGTQNREEVYLFPNRDTMIVNFRLIDEHDVEMKARAVFNKKQ